LPFGGGVKEDILVAAAVGEGDDGQFFLARSVTFRALANVVPANGTSWVAVTGGAGGVAVTGGAQSVATKALAGPSTGGACLLVVAVAIRAFF
jgi:hypothetical protein